MNRNIVKSKLKTILKFVLGKSRKTLEHNRNNTIVK